VGCRHLLLVLGDQLNRDSAVFDGLDPREDAVWMAETRREATHVWCHKQRLVMFFAAMRHFRDDLREAGVTVHYHALGEDPTGDRGEDFAAVLGADIQRLQPRRLIVVEPGDYRVWQMLRDCARVHGIELEIRADRHFYCGIAEFRDWAEGRRELLLETFYRRLRKRHGILMDGEQPEGGVWNLDRDNRRSFGRAGPGKLPAPRAFPPDALTREVMAMVARRFPDHPGRMEAFALPVTRTHALQFLEDFIAHRLADFGAFEDAMWAGEAVLYHSRLSVALNLKLLDPRECVDAALQAHRAGRAPLNSVEGFVRQILGWREYIRGIYWLHMPDYAERNALDCEDREVPGFFWNGETDMQCVAGAMQAVLEHAYTHHIQRLMVLGLFAQLLGVHPRRFHDWHMAMYLDAVDWVSLPNALGMSQYGDGGIVGSKPYCATGKYIQRMSNYCGQCRYNPGEAVGEDACPFTTLYWDFLERHAARFRPNRRMALQVKNLDRKRAGEREAIGERAAALRARADRGERF